MLINHMPTEWIVFFMLYGGGALVALIACLYLCLRKGNAFAPDTTSPVRLRHWTAAFCAVIFLGHLWWLLFYIFSYDIHSVGYLVVTVLDCVGLLTTIAGTMYAMLQDRKRPVWPIIIATIPFVIFAALNMVYPDSHFMQMAITYFLLLYVSFTIYMVFAVRQYGRWLRDNYADLEHKEVWVSHVVVIVLFLAIVTYGFDGGDLIMSYLVQIIGLAMIGLLLWRVETLPQLENIPMEQPVQPTSQPQQSSTILSTIEQLLEERCVGNQLYLQHDLTLHQLTKAIGTNRTYLSQYFASRGKTYNNYVNDLRINHFMRLYHEANAANQSITVQQLAHDSGFRSYSTFSLAFKHRMGQSVTAWIRKTAN